MISKRKKKRKRLDKEGEGVRRTFCLTDSVKEFQKRND